MKNAQKNLTCNDASITNTAKILSDKWTMLIMYTLGQSPQRYSELERWLEGISTRTLTLKLQKLQDEGLITKLKDGAYAPTKKGKGLKMVAQAMIKYSQKFL